MNTVEDEVNDKRRKKFTRDGARHRQREAQHGYDDDYGDVVPVLKDVHAGEQQRHDRDRDAHARRFFKGAIEQAAVDQLFSERRGKHRHERGGQACVDGALDEDIEICLAFSVNRGNAESEKEEKRCHEEAQQRHDHGTGIFGPVEIDILPERTPPAIRDHEPHKDNREHVRGKNCRDREEDERLVCGQRFRRRRTELDYAIDEIRKRDDNRNSQQRTDTREPDAEADPHVVPGRRQLHVLWSGLKWFAGP